MQHCDVIIAGGGMVGMSMAVAIARCGISVCLIEKTALPQQLESHFDGRVSALALGSVRLLAAIGAWDDMLPHAEPIKDIRVSDGDTPFFLNYDHKEVGSEPFGYIVENRYIRHALHEAAKKLPNIAIIENASIVAFRSDSTQARLALEDSREFSAALVLAADGKFSTLRDLAGIEAIHRDYNQTAIVCTIAHSKSHHGLAQERFLPAGPFAVLPMTQQRSSLVWVEPKDRVSIYMELPDAECEQEITERVGDYLGKITLAGKRFTYPLSLMHAKDYICTRFALIGDAAHSMHPIAGQGVNLGFRDVAVLEELIRKQHTLGLDIGVDSLLEHYRRWRRFDNVSMLAVTDGLNQLFCSSLLPVKTARGLGMWGVSKMPFLKKFFMSHAMGLVGDLPDSFKKVG
jgi:2-octaprenyl-6-methoxyphenol hydroxylase